MTALLAHIMACLVMGGAPAPAASRGAVAGTTLVRAAIAAVTPPGALKVSGIVPAGACPGHYDISPSQAMAMRNADLVLLHEFQRGLKVERWAPADRVRYLPDAPSLLELPAWERVLDASAKAVADTWPGLGEAVRNRLKTAKQRATAAAVRSRSMEGGFRGRPVLAASMQAAFVRSLGFRVLEVIPRVEDLSPVDWVRLKRRKPVMVVANLQEGVDVARQLAEGLGVPLAVLSNFPDAEGFGDSWESLLEGNLERLKAACPK